MFGYSCIPEYLCKQVESVQKRALRIIYKNSHIRRTRRLLLQKIECDPLNEKNLLFRQFTLVVCAGITLDCGIVNIPEGR